VRALDALARGTLVARPLRTILTIVGIALGVGVLVAAQVFNAGLDAAAEQSVRDQLGRADLRIASFEERGLSPASLAAVATTPGIVVVAPELERRTYPAPDPRAGPGLPVPVTVIGVDPVADAALHDRPLTSGALLGATDRDDALVSDALARADGLTVGATITLNGSAESGPHPFRVAGILAPVPGDPDPVGRTVVVPLWSAQALFGTDAVSRADVGFAPGSTVPAVSAALERALTTELYTLATPEQLIADLRASTADFRITIALVAAVSLFGGAFLIFNTMAMTVAERARDVGLLRAAGMTRRQVTLLVLISAGHLGVAGVLLGLAAGVGLAAAVAAFLSPGGGALAIHELLIPPSALLLGALLGFGVTIAAALEPALRAARISPVAALTARLEQTAVLRARLRWLTVVFAVVGIAGITLWPGAADGGAGLIRALAVYALLLAVTLVSPWLVGPLGLLVGTLARPFLPAEERLTRSALVRDPSRTALTVGALAVALAVLVALGGVAATTRRAATAWLSEVVPGDALLTSIRPVALDEPQLADLAAVPGVARLSPIGRFAVAVGGQRLDAAAVVGGDLLADGRLELSAGDRASALPALDAGGAVIVPSAIADRLGIPLGGSLQVRAGRDIVALRVVGIAARTIPGSSGEAVLVGWKDATERLGVVGADLFAVRYTPGEAATAASTLAPLARAAALEPASLQAVAGSIGASLDRLFALLTALAVVALVVAALGIVNTLSMNVLERVRELGFLRAAGLTRRQARWLVMLEAAVLGAVGAIIGVSAGIAGGVILAALGAGPGVTYDPGWWTIVVALVGGVALAVVASAWPANLAARIEIVRAVQYE
jgi:putative ABC transport system permease protein